MVWNAVKEDINDYSDT